MIDFRYHAMSLAAVFLALAIGILIGVGISGRGFVSDAERTRLNGEIADLTEQLDAANANSEDLELRQDAAADFVEGAYPVLAENRLAGKRIAVVVLGPVEQDSLPFVERAIEEDADGRIARMRALTLPLRLEAVESALGSHAGARRLRRRRAARQPRPRSRPRARRRRRDAALGCARGRDRRAADGRLRRPGGRRRRDPLGRSRRRAAARSFLAGLYQGLNSTGVPAVGVEPTRVEQSAIPVFQQHGLSTVDGIDDELGQLALVLLLGEATPGDYGIRDTAEDGILPPIEPLPPPSE